METFCFHPRQKNLSNHRSLDTVQAEEPHGRLVLTEEEANIFSGELERMQGITVTMRDEEIGSLRVSISK